MADIAFTPKFTHTDWVDDVDVVRAGDHDDPTGFNGHFNAIQADLDNLSAVVDQIDAALNQELGAPPETRLVVPHTQLSNRGAWQLSARGTVLTNPGQGGTTVLDVAMPSGVRLKSLRVTGNTAGGRAVTVSLIMVPFAGGTGLTIATATANTGPFDVSQPVDADHALTDTLTNRYVIQADAGAASSNIIVIGGIQLTYTAP